MDDPIRSHPTRAEQLEILVTLIADQARPGDRVLDLGCGTGYVAKMILDRRPDLSFTGLDRKAESLAAARANLSAHGERVTLVEGDLDAVGAIELPDDIYRFVLTALTFHDLDDVCKRAVIGWVAQHLSPDGYFFLYDRIRLTAPALFALQQSIWARIERIHGAAMRGAASFAAYQADLAPNNRPASLREYLKWFDKAGLAAACLHLHGNVALIAGTASVSPETLAIK